MTTRPSPISIVSLAVAVLALLTALGGSAYAVARIDGRTLVDRSVPGSKLVGDSVTGAQVDEGSLEGVARSSNFRRVRFEKTTTGDAAGRVLALGAPRVTFSCDYDDAHTNWALFGTSAKGRTGWDLGSVFHAGEPVNRPEQDGGVLGSDRQFLASGGASNGEYFREVGTIVFNNDKRHETISLSFAVFVSASDHDGYCNLAGTAFRTTG